MHPPRHPPWRRCARIAAASARTTPRCRQRCSVLQARRGPRDIWPLSWSCSCVACPQHAAWRTKRRASPRAAARRTFARCAGRRDGPCARRASVQELSLHAACILPSILPRDPPAHPPRHPPPHPPRRPARRGPTEDEVRFCAAGRPVGPSQTTTRRALHCGVRGAAGQSCSRDKREEQGAVTRAFGGRGDTRFRRASSLGHARFAPSR